MLIIVACNNKKIIRENDYLLGKWHSSEGGDIYFNTNGTFIVKEISGSKFFSGFDQYHNTLIFGRGKWRIIDRNGARSVILGFENIDNLQAGISIQLELKRANRIFTKKWKLFTWVGDPDDNITYEFEKK